MKTLWIDHPIAYDGSQLRAHWILMQCAIPGDALVAFRGPCNVVRSEIADLADLAGPGIAGDDMLHFIWESFAMPDLLLAVHRQRLLSAQAAEVLLALAPMSGLRREGDDLFIGDGKLSISIATVTPVSSVLHFAVNVTEGGAPVHTATLQQLAVNPREFAERLFQRAAEEQLSIVEARAKVRAKGEWES
ncbi:hypothetical protein LBMAG49_11790 [Planctomycetota bacterium]|jgi:hypothetical protein|nr:DUF366 family protein [Planctomycetota bacterium]GDY01850.1 hypothetical protein LBMAG49_11790 [Planctomycetota bacterium]